jgi:hypothetical protein
MLQKRDMSGREEGAPALYVPAPTCISAEHDQEEYLAIIRELTHVEAAARRLRLYYIRMLDKKKKVCPHSWQMVYPQGPRDNGEYWEQCSLCGTMK